MKANAKQNVIRFLCCLLIMVVFPITALAMHKQENILSIPVLSPDGSVLMAGSGGSLVTADGTWTLENRASTGGEALVLLNGQATSALASQLLVTNCGMLYASNNSGAWFKWIGSGWKGTSNPLSALPGGISPDGSVLLAGNGGSLVTADGIWTLENRAGMEGEALVLLNGQSKSAIARELLVLNGGNLYISNNSGDWFKWIGTGWTRTSNQLSSPPGGISPDGSRLMVNNGGSLITADGTWTFQNRAGVAGEGMILLNGQSTAAMASVLYVLDSGTLYASKASGNWFKWIGSRWKPIANPHLLMAGAATTTFPVHWNENFGAWGTSTTPILSSSVSDVELASSAVVISDGVTKVAIVSVDTTLIYDFQTEVIKAQILPMTGISTVLITATHDHSTLNPDPGEHTDRINNAIIASIIQANNNLVPAKIGAGNGTYAWNYNRVQRNPGPTPSTNPPILTHCGEDRACYITKYVNDPVDSSVGVIRLLDMNNQSIATLVNYAIHNVIFGDGPNTTPSGDLFGTARIDIEASLGGVALILQGAAGDLEPWCSLVFSTTSGLPVLPYTLSQANTELSTRGQALADVVTAVSAGISNYSSMETINTMQTIMPVSFTCAIGSRGGIELNTLKIGSSIGFATVGGELFNSLGSSVRQRTTALTIKGLTCSPIPSVTFILGYTNDAAGYIPEQMYCDDDPTKWICDNSTPPNCTTTSLMQGFRTHYEPNAMCVPCGTGERVVDDLVSMLNNGVSN